METNDSDMSFSEWDIVGSSSFENKEGHLEDYSEDVTALNSSENTTKEDVHEGSPIEVVHKGSCVEDVQKGSSVEDVLEEQEHPQSESSGSSSDIDIIDENAFDDHHSGYHSDNPDNNHRNDPDDNHGSVPDDNHTSDPDDNQRSDSANNHRSDSANNHWRDFINNHRSDSANNYRSDPSNFGRRGTIGFSISCGIRPTPDRGRVPPLRERTPNPVTDIIVQHRDSPRRNPHVKDYCIILGIACLLGFFMHIPETPVDTIKEMEKRILILQEENRELKSNVISKIEDDKPFIALEEQIKALKGENLKLSRFMQDLIRELEEKTIIFKKESEIQGKESYQNEIDKLKEQVNILQIDNDELQKQLVRMRYSVYSPPAQDPKSTEKKETSDDKSEDQNENSTEILSEEIKELRKKLYSEVEKLKNWKESVQHLMKELENRPKEFDKKEGHGSKKYADKNDKFASKKTSKGNQEEGFEDSENEAFGRIPELNITDLVFRYIGVDKKKVKGVFESVGHYFKKAQEKTKDIFDESMKNEMWNFIGGLRKQWHMMKKAYFPKHHKRAQSSDDNDNKASFHETYNEKFERNHQKDSKSRMQQETPTKRHGPHRYDTKDEFKSKQNVEENSKWQSYKQNLENLAEKTISLNSWLFERAAHRSELRDKEEDVNWFLKNRKEADAPETDNFQQEEEAADPYDNIDFFGMD